MFTKKPDRATAGPEPVRIAGSQPSYAGTSQNWTPTGSRGTDSMGPSVIGADLLVMGNLESKGEVTVEGQIQGDIHCAMLTVGDNAQVTGGIVAEEVVVRGRVMGSIRGLRVTLQASSHVEGDVFHKALAIEQGAFFEGKSRRSEDPLGGAEASNGRSDLGAFGAAVGTPN
jgi:cytoskeletal protein CcmA (bactofilin family)